ncbi:MAG TPA: hypothetical protein VI318_19740 [Baekduia sp.]
MLAELPFVSADEIAAEYKPVGPITTKAALRTLSRKGVISLGIETSLRGERGLMTGSLHLYSACNLDAVRLHRRGDDAAALKVAVRAGQIEQIAVRERVAPCIAQHWQRTSSLREALVGTLASDVGPALRQIIETTSDERSAISDDAEIEKPLFAWILKLHGEIADLRLDHADTTLPLPTADLAPTIAAREGEVVAMRWQRVAPGKTLLTTAPAIDLGGDESPFEQPLPSDAARVDVTRALAASPTIRRPQRIKIGAST